jgi:hypothetical protein
MCTHEIGSVTCAPLQADSPVFIVALSKMESYTAETVEVNGVSLPVGRLQR